MQRSSVTPTMESSASWINSPMLARSLRWPSALRKQGSWHAQDALSSHTIVIKDSRLATVDNFRYLGSLTSSNVSLDAEINARIGNRATVVSKLQKRVWENKTLTLNTKMKAYRPVSSASSSTIAKHRLHMPNRRPSWMSSTWDVSAKYWA